MAIFMKPVQTPPLPPYTRSSQQMLFLPTFCDGSTAGVASRLFSGIQFRVATTVNSTSGDQKEVPELPVCVPSFCGYWSTRAVCIAFVFHIPVDFQIPVRYVTWRSRSFLGLWASSRPQLLPQPLSGPLSQKKSNWLFFLFNSFKFFLNFFKFLFFPFSFFFLFLSISPFPFPALLFLIFYYCSSCVTGRWIVYSCVVP